MRSMWTWHRNITDRVSVTARYDLSEWAFGGIVDVYDVQAVFLWFGPFQASIMRHAA